MLLNDHKPERIQSGRPTFDPVTRKLKTPYAFLHKCRVPGCVNEGSIGIGVNLKRRKAGVWFCHAHRTEADAFHSEIGAAVAAGGLDM